MVEQNQTSSALFFFDLSKVGSGWCVFVRRFFLSSRAKPEEDDACVQHTANCRTGDGACHYFRLVHNGSFLGYISRNAEIDSIVTLTLAKVKLHYILLDKTATQIKRYYRIEIVC
jgi:hypothetical protein